MRSKQSLISFGAVVALNVIGIATFDVLPTVVEGAQQSLHFSESDIGVLSAMIMAGSAIGSVLAKYWVRRLDWRLAARIALLGTVAGNALSIVLHERLAFVALQFVAGFFAGSLYALTLTILSDGDEPDRDFGIVIAAQVAFQAIGLFAGPALLHLNGIDAILAAFVALTAAGFLIVGRVPRRGRHVPDSVDFRALLRPGTLLALLGCSFFLLSAGCYWTYVALIGHDAGFDEEHIARSLVVGVAAGFVGALTAAAIGSRLPRNAMLMLGMAMVVAAVLLLLGHASLVAFVTSCCLFNFSWNFSVAYQYAAVNSVDASGRGVSLAPAFHGAGASIGPAIAALFVAPHLYGSVMWLVSGGAVLSVLCFLLATRIHSRAAEPVTAGAVHPS
jgi:MFS transporter, DHA1 family, inner membrane transport protein